MKLTIWFRKIHFLNVNIARKANAVQVTPWLSVTKPFIKALYKGPKLQKKLLDWKWPPSPPPFWDFTEISSHLLPQVTKLLPMSLSLSLSLSSWCICMNCQCFYLSKVPGSWGISDSFHFRWTLKGHFVFPFVGWFTSVCECCLSEFVTFYDLFVV